MSPADARSRAPRVPERAPRRNGSRRGPSAPCRPSPAMRMPGLLRPEKPETTHCYRPTRGKRKRRPVSKRRSDGPPPITRCENQLDILTRCVNLSFEGRHDETQRNQNEAEDAGGEGHDGRPQEGSGVPRSGHQQGRRDDDGLGRCEPARGARARRARRVEREGRREALRRAAAGRDRGAPRLAGRGAPLADGVAGRCEGPGPALPEGPRRGRRERAEGVQDPRDAGPGGDAVRRAAADLCGAGGQGNPGDVHRRRVEDEGPVRAELSARALRAIRTARRRPAGPFYFGWALRLSSRSSSDLRRSRSADTSSRRRSGSGSPPSRLASARAPRPAPGTMVPHPARLIHSWRTRSISRWLETMPSRLDFIERCRKSCQASPCLMSWWRKPIGRPPRWLRSFSRMIWVRVTAVRSSPDAASTTEISLPARIISSISSRVTYRLSWVS